MEQNTNTYPRAARPDEIHHFKHFNPRRPSKGNDVYNAMLHAHIRDARRVAGRKLKDGTPTKTFHAGSWAAALIYLTVLESIGKHLVADGGGKRRFETVVRQYSDHSVTTAHALYAFRCALAHGFSFENLNSDKQDLNWKFRAREQDGTQSLISIGPEPESGRPRLCYVYVAVVGEFVEEVWRKFVTDLENGKELLIRELDIMKVTRDF